MVKSKQEVFTENSRWDFPSGDSFTWDDAFQEAKESVLKHEPIILFGPPGVALLAQPPSYVV
ncbi:MAG: hypothetical protein ACD_19C00264G0006, partial [uncultured bacterium]